MTMLSVLVLAAVLHDPFARIQAKVPAAQAVALPHTSDWAARYITPPPGVGGLSGSELYLFPDGKYIYCEWADVEPRTVYDKGEWTVTPHGIRLTSDRDVTWHPEIDRDLIAVRRPRHPNEVLLVGTGRPLEFLEMSDEDTIGTLAAVALVRERTLTAGATDSWRASLMKESWHPERFAPSKRR